MIDSEYDWICESTRVEMTTSLTMSRSLSLTRIDLISTLIQHGNPRKQKSRYNNKQERNMICSLGFPATTVSVCLTIHFIQATSWCMLRQQCYMHQGSSSYSELEAVVLYVHVIEIYMRSFMARSHSINYQNVVIHDRHLLRLTVWWNSWLLLRICLTIQMIPMNICLTGNCVVQ